VKELANLIVRQQELGCQVADLLHNLDGSLACEEEMATVKVLDIELKAFGLAVRLYDALCRKNEVTLLMPHSRSDGADGNQKGEGRSVACT
jgi:hypothetical protein